MIKVLEGDKREVDEAVLSVFVILLYDNVWENGSNYIDKILGGVEVIVRVLEFGILKVKEKALWILERIFRVEDYRYEYGGCV